MAGSPRERYSRAMSSTQPRILLTGATGFVGRCVHAALKGRADILPSTIAGRRADLLVAEDRRALLEEQRPEILIHLAWYTEHGRFWEAPENTAWCDASIDLFEGFYAMGGRRIVGTGSCAEYDWSAAQATFPEDSPLAPKTHYGREKVRLALALKAAAERADASWAWARIFFSFGAGEPGGRLLPLMRDAVRTQQPLEIGPGDAVRDFWPVETLGASIAALALSDVEGAVNTASGEATRFDEIARTLEQLAGVSGIILPGRRPLGEGDPLQLVAHTLRLREEVGFADRPDLREALSAFLKAPAD